MTNSTGTIVWQQSFDPYGLPTTIINTTAGDFGYCGYYVHSRSGLNLTRTRAYSASLGRFINRDPIEEAGGVNLYAYVANDPVEWSDPSGHNPLAGLLVGLSPEGAAALAGALTALGIAGNWLQNNAQQLGKNIGDFMNQMGKNRADKDQEREEKRGKAAKPKKCDRKPNYQNTPQGQQAQNAQAEAAKQAAEQATGQEMTPDQERQFHDNISHQDLGFEDLVGEATRILNGN